MPLTSNVEADEKGSKRRRADYIILKYLDDVESAKEHELDQSVKHIHDNLIEQEHSSPFYFRAGGSNGPNSRELNEAVDRCLHFGRIKLTEDNEYAITSDGEEYLDDTSTLERHGVSDGFREQVSDLVAALF